MTTRKVRRAVTASILVAASCNVYNPSLLVGHGGAGSGAGATGGAGGTTGGAGAGADAGGRSNAGNGTGGASGKSSGGTAGRASGGSAGASGGSGNESAAGGQGGEAGDMTGEGGTVSAGTGGTGGVGGGGGSAGTAASAGTGGSAAGTGGGSAGTGAIAGMGGTAGMGGASAGMAGTAGAAAGMGGAGGMGPVPASGCANLSVPLVNASDKAHFVITLTTAANMSASTATISMRVYVLAGSGGILVNYVQDTNNHFMPSTTVRPTLSTLVGAWTTLTWNVGTETAVNSIDKTNIKRIGIEVTANNSTGLTNPTRIYVDWVSASVVTPAPSFPFDTSGTVDTTASPGVDVGGQVLWLNSASSDTSATGVTLGWLTSCP